MIFFPWDIDDLDAGVGAGPSASPVPRSDPRTQTLELELRRLRTRVESLMLANVAMWELLSAKAGFKIEQLAAKMEEIDLRDGTKDGKITPAQTCGKCGRRLSARHRRCLYCGDPNLKPA
jgi:hypothetical protein